MLIEIHMIQNHSPSNLNRDDLGAPKMCLFGGVTRARISSQCLKRSIRNPGWLLNPDDPKSERKGGGQFADAMRAYLGSRTKMFPWLVSQELEDSTIQMKLKDKDERDADVAKQKKGIVAACKTIARAEDKGVSNKNEKQQKDKRDQTPQLIFLGPAQARSFLEKLLELKGSMRPCYDYFLDPATIFESLLGPELAKTSLGPEQRDRALKAGWRIRNTKSRLTKLHEALRPSGSGGEPADGVDSETPPARMPDAEQLTQPDEEEIAKEIARGLEALAQRDEMEFGKVVSTRAAKSEPKLHRKQDKPPANYDDFVKTLKRITSKVSVDIALFGRMTTSDYITDVEAAMQVAHAVSTHAVVNEVDFWTAVDDLGSTQASAHLGEAMFNSACFYKYLCLDWDQLLFNLAGPEPDAAKDKEAHQKWASEIKPNAVKLAACTLGHFLRAAALTSPSGKQNSFASNCEPCGILVEIKKNGKIPTSYANAFAEPVERIGKPDDDVADEKSLEGRSVACLADHVRSVRNAYGIKSTLLWYSPKLWRFPLQYWEHADDGKKLTAKLVTNRRFDVLGGKEEEPNGMVEAVVEEVVPGLKWVEVCNVGKVPSKEA